MKHLTVLLSGALFGVGLGLGGMLEPARVVGFLDLFGVWDPTLALVMAGALAVNIVAYRLTTGRMRPWFDERFHLPDASSVDARLVFGAALFGMGWALAGYCPGPAMANLASGTLTSVLFLVAMGLGAFVGGLRSAPTSVSLDG